MSWRRQSFNFEILTLDLLLRQITTFLKVLWPLFLVPDPLIGKIYQRKGLAPKNKKKYIYLTYLIGYLHF